MFNILKEKISNFISSLKGKKDEGEKKEVKEREIEAEEKKEVKKEKEKKEEKKTKEERLEPTLTTKIKGIFLKEITINEKDVESALEDFKFQLIEADVAYEVSEELIENIKKNIVGKKIEYKNFDSFIKGEIKSSLFNVIKQENFDLIEFIQEKRKVEKPVKILFVGPNGHGKTTTIAKIAHLLKTKGISCAISASDTFRAAAIEQTVEHAKKLNVPVVKSFYGSDPTAVAFDCIKYAQSKDIDVVLIDTAGRQETNRNLIEEMKKMDRVIKPHLKILIGESIVGNAIINQINEFNSAIHLDGVILTKVDCDPKGGVVLSIKKTTNLPILYMGTGQNYDDLIKFDENFIISKII
jgi:fused signal recognition particle receptor